MTPVDFDALGLLACLLLDEVSGHGVFLLQCMSIVIAHLQSFPQLNLRITFL